MVSGGIIASIVLFLLFGGIKRIGAVSTALVPVMFVLYIGSSLWILLANLDMLGTIFSEIFRSALAPQALESGVVVGGIVSALRWGIFKGIQACEAGIGTQSIPHSMAQTQDAHSQGLLAMLSTYTAGFVAFLSGCVSLITKTWQNPDLPLGISMVAASFYEYFSSFGIGVIAITTFLFAFGTILGNCYNGSQAFGFLTNNRMIRGFYVGACFMVFIGAVADVKTFWSLMDIVLAAMTLPHVGALCYFAWKSSASLETGKGLGTGEQLPAKVS
jgi:AGCS family alanine or glycine:cation symporter